MTNAMHPSQWLFDFLKGYERFRPTAYKPTKNDVWTCGFGHTNGVTEATTCDTGQAQAWLTEDTVTAVNAVNSLVTVPLTQNQFDALVSLVFNAGAEPLRKTLGSLLNAGNYYGASRQFKRWDYQAGKPLPGLDPRRAAEAARFLTP